MTTLNIVFIVLGALLFGVTVFGIVLALLPKRREKQTAGQLGNALESVGFEPGVEEEEEVQKTKVPSLIMRLVGYSRQFTGKPWFDNLVRLATKPERVHILQQKMDRAGWGFLFTPKEFIGAQIIGAIGLTIIGLAYLLIFEVEWYWWLALLILPLIGYRLTEANLTRQIEERQRRIQLDLPRATDILAVAVDAGLTLDKAIELYCERFTGPLAQEFGKVQDDLKVGKRRREALRAMSERTGVADVELLISAILQAERFGVPVAQVLLTQSADLKVRRNQYLREQTLKAPVKMLLPMTIFILPALLCVMLGPLILQFMRGESFF
ncbi:MAG: type II secretion system F family protein [Chloroflexota bacterium]